MPREVPFHEVEWAVASKPRREEEAETEPLTWVTIERYLDRLPTIEQDILELRYRDGKLWRDIAEILDTSYPTPLQRAKRAVARIQWLLANPTMAEAEIRTELQGCGLATWYELVATFLRTTSLAETARQLAMTQSGARCAIWKLKRQLPEGPLKVAVESTLGNLGILWDQRCVNKLRPSRVCSDDTVREIRSDAAHGVSIKTLVLRTGLQEGNIYGIVHRFTRRDVV